MAVAPEVIDIELNDEENIKINLDSLPSSNLGPAAELLMNDKKISKSGDERNTQINIGELNELEDELNNLSESLSDNNKFSNNDMFINKEQDSGNVTFNIDSNNFDSVGKSTTNIEQDKKTWDGYGKFNDIPINPPNNPKKQPELSKEELLREKFKYLRKLEDLENKGVQLTKKYTMESPLAEMQG